ncbi:MAG: hypothetical protein KAT77_01380 [Nanoarchaeota archaeon]|nr:hypothetical protein [Nanoarchaeota archaeon]
MAKKDKWSLTPKQRTELNEARKEKLAKKQSTREIKVQELREKIEAEKQQREAKLNQPGYLIYFVHEVGDTYQIIAEVYADSPDQITEAIEQLGRCLDNLEKKLSGSEAAFAIHGFDREVTKVCSSKSFFGIELEYDTPQRQDYFVPVLLVQGTLGKLETLSHLLSGYKTRETEELDLRSTSQPDQTQ